MSDTSIIRAIQAIDQARLEVRPYVGDLAIACDSADEVFLHALKTLGHNTSELRQHPGTAAAMWPALRRLTPKSRHIAMDKKAEANRGAMFPNAGRLNQR